MARIRIDRGLTLIEILVALLVLSVGLVGVAGIHLFSLKTAHSSFYQSIGTMMATDAEERMWLYLGANGSISPGDLPAIRTAWTSEWQARYVPPGLSLELTSPGSNARWMDVDIVVSWQEGRFDDLNAGIESFGYRTRIIRE